MSPVYTLSMPLSKIYVVTTPELMSFIDRRPGIFSFNPTLVEFSKRILTVSQPSWEKLARGTLEESGKHELSHDLLRAGQESMKPGEDLECLTKRMLTSSISFFDGIDVESLSRIVMISTTGAKSMSLCAEQTLYTARNAIRTRILVWRTACGTFPTPLFKSQSD